jgi:preprotein translocase subunit Sec63
MTADTLRLRLYNKNSKMMKKFRISLIMILISFSCGNIFIEGVSAHQHTSSENFYELLEIKQNASKAEIKKAYRSLSMKYHPDKN